MYKVIFVIKDVEGKNLAIEENIFYTNRTASEIEEFLNNDIRENFHNDAEFVKIISIQEI